MPDRESQTLPLPDGRTLGYAAYGAPDGPVVLSCHGWPSSRLSGRRGAGAAERLGIRLIVPDRPGYGLSSPHPGHPLRDWATDAAALLDALRIDRCAVTGTSGGGPFACALAHFLPQRVSRLGLIAALPPVAAPDARAVLPRSRRLLYGFARAAPPLVDLILRLRARAVRRDPARAIDAVVRRLPAPDRAIAARDDVRRNLIDDYAEAFRRGHRGAAADARTIVRPWGFSTSAITTPAVLWQGELDTNVPVGMGGYYAHTLPRCDAHFLPGAGHLWAIDHMDEVLAALIG